MDNYQEALKAFCDTLACKSGGGVKSSIDPRDVAGLAVFLRDGRVAAFGQLPPPPTAAPPSERGAEA